MSTSNGVVHRAEQAHLESVRKAKSAAAAGEQSPSAVASPASARAPESYQSQFFAVLQDIVSSAHGERKKPSIAGKRTDVVARLLTLSRRLEDGCKPALYQQAYFAARLWQANPSVGSTVSAVLDDLEFCSSRNSPIYTVMYGLLASLLGLSGGALAILALSSWVYAWASGSPWPAVIRDPYCALLTSPLLVASTFGMLGGRCECPLATVGVRTCHTALAPLSPDDRGGAPVCGRGVCKRHLRGLPGRHRQCQCRGRQYQRIIARQSLLFYRHWFFVWVQ